MKNYIVIVSVLAGLFSCEPRQSSKNVLIRDLEYSKELNYQIGRDYSEFIALVKLRITKGDFGHEDSIFYLSYSAVDSCMYDLMIKSGGINFDSYYINGFNEKIVSEFSIFKIGLSSKISIETNKIESSNMISSSIVREELLSLLKGLQAYLLTNDIGDKTLGEVLLKLKGYNDLIITEYKNFIIQDLYSKAI